MGATRLILRPKHVRSTVDGESVIWVVLSLVTRSLHQIVCPCEDVAQTKNYLH